MRDGFPVVDAHNHSILEKIDTTNIEPSGRAQRPLGSMLVEMLCERITRFGIDHSVLIVHAWANSTPEDIKTEHDRVAADMARYPGTFTGIATADPRHKQRACDEIKRAIEELGFRGIKLLPHFHNYLLDGPLVEPLVQLAAHYQVPMLYCSQWHYYGAEPWRWVRLARLYPQVTFVMCHMGIDPFVTESLVVPHMVMNTPNIVLDTSATTTDPYGVIQAPVKLLGAGRVMWASDSGRYLHPAVELLKVELADLPPEDKRQVLGGTAARVFGITSLLKKQQ